MTDSNTIIIRKLDEILNEFESLKHRLDVLENSIKQDTQKMSSHVDLVETIYDNVKKPLNNLYYSVTGNHRLLPDTTHTQTPIDTIYDTSLV